jgi:transposase
LRKSIDGLVGVGKRVLAEAPLSGSGVVFCNRRGNYLQLVGWERTDWCLVAKRLEPGRFRLPGEARTPAGSIPVFQLRLDGIALGYRHKQ